MLKMKLIVQRKQSFFQPEDQFRYCTGSKSAYNEDFKSDGYSFIEWDAKLKDLPVDKIRLLILVPSKPQLKKAEFPDYISELPKLEHIVFDMYFLKNKETKSLPASVRSMTLSRPLAFADLLKDLSKNKVEWDDTARLQKLEALLIIAGEEKEEIINQLSAKALPKLTYLGFQFTQASELDVFGRFRKLLDLELSHVRDYPLFDHINHLPLVSLDLTGADIKFDLAGIKRLKTLKYVRLNGLRCEVDCCYFKEIPGLMELVVLNSRNVTNVEALLECKKLVNINFLDTGKPFKGISEKFEGKFEVFEIKYA